MRSDKLLCVALFCLSGAVWAVDTDKDTLPDDWELAHGRNPNVADYAVEVTNTTTCVRKEGGVDECSNGPSGQGYQFLQSDNETIVTDQGKYCGDMSGMYGPPISRSMRYTEYKKATCSVTGSRTVRCTGSYRASININDYITDYLSPYCTSLPLGFSDSQQPITLTTAGDIAHIAVGATRICALTTRGVECASLTIYRDHYQLKTIIGPSSFVNAGYWLDSDGDTIGRPSDFFDLDAAETTDTDNDTIGNNADWDDDNDGVLDTVDVAPLNSGDASEITLPLNSNYKGLQLKNKSEY